MPELVASRSPLRRRGLRSGIVEPARSILDACGSSCASCAALRDSLPPGRRRAGSRPVQRLALGSLRSPRSKSGPYQTGIWCPHQSWRRDAPGFDVLQPVVIGLLARGRDDLRAARRAPPPARGPTILAVSTNHWSVSIGSITTFERSPKGLHDRLGSTTAPVPGARPVSLSTDFFSVVTASPSAVIASTTRLRASYRSSPRSSSGTRFRRRSRPRSA